MPGKTCLGMLKYIEFESKIMCFCVLLLVKYWISTHTFLFKRENE